MLEILVFIALSMVLAYLSRASLRLPRSHGFHRFFAALFTLALVVLNADHWFADPLAPRQILSWFLLAASVALVVGGAAKLKAAGKPSRARVSEVPLAGFERTTSLVTEGIYRYLRHPMYASGFYGTWGAFFKDPSWLGLVLASGATSFWAATAKSEEAECIRYFGAAYRDYIQRSRAFVPFLF